MIYEPSIIAVLIFAAFVALTLGLSFYLGGKAKSSEGYFAAHGQIPWFVNGVAFAGDYLSAASFLGICGMIAFYGYDGFLYSIGFLAGWIVALFIIAEPMKKLGKFTFADALNARFQSPGIKIAAGISTLAVSVFYLIPQMVGAGVLVQPLLGLPHWAGVVIVGVTVILIVVTAGMVSTTWVQFLKGTLLVVFSTILTVLILQRGFTVPQTAEQTGLPEPIGPVNINYVYDMGFALPESVNRDAIDMSWDSHVVSLGEGEGKTYWSTVFLPNELDAEPSDAVLFLPAQTVKTLPDGTKLYNGKPLGKGEGEGQLQPVGYLSELPNGEEKSGPLGLFSFFTTMQNSKINLWSKKNIVEEGGAKVLVYYQKPTSGADVLRPGTHPKFAGIRSKSLIKKFDFLSLMLALFCGTASLPHILIRYYTVKDEASARKSTIVGIASIGGFYVLTLYLGLGAMTSGAMDVTNTNMAAPLLARSISETLFAIISAIAFTTVLGTVSGLILASAGAVAHDLLQNFSSKQYDDQELVKVAKIASVIVGAIAILLGILFEGMNVGYLVGWAFSVAASANLPSLVMLLFWSKTTKQGIITAILVGMISSLGWILLSADTYSSVYGIDASQSFIPFSQPGLVTIPLGFVTLVVVSLMTQPGEEQKPAEPATAS